MQTKNEQLSTTSKFLKNLKSVSELAYAEDMNITKRPAMEDFHFTIDDIFNNGQSGLFAVIDGHGGADPAQFVSKTLPNVLPIQINKQYPKLSKDIPQLLTKTFELADNQLRLVGASDSGCTCCLAFVTKENGKKYLYCSNLGDTRAILIKEKEVERITVDHKATNIDEQERIKAAGGVISNNRVSGSLAITRALGDFDLKKSGVINEPYIKKIEITQDCHYLIIATDGLWDVIDDNEAYEIIKDMKNIQNMCKQLVSKSIEKGSADNISILILKF